MSEYLLNIKEICELILPMLGVITLTVLIVLLIETTKAIKAANNTLTSSKGTIEKVNDSINKVQAPLDTVVKVSNTVDKAHDATIDGIEKAKDYVVKNADVLKEKVTSLIKKENHEDLLQEPSPEDIIGGK